MMGADEKIPRLASHLIASSFYYENLFARTADDPTDDRVFCKGET